MFTRMTLRKKIAALITTSVLIVAVAAWIMMYRTERSKLIDDNRETLSRYLDGFVSAGESSGLEGISNLLILWSKIYPEGRVTVVNINGDVVLDNKAKTSAMDNHYKRPEVMQAFSSGSGAEMRYSKTQNEWVNYMARKFTLAGTDGGETVIRISYPVEKLGALGWTMGKSFLYSLEIILLLVWGGAYWMLRVVMRPLNSLSRAAESIASGGTARFPITDDPEMHALSNALNSMSDSLKLSIKEAQERKEEMALLVGTLPIGLILIDDNKKVRYINVAASTLCGRADVLPVRGASIELVLPCEEMSIFLDSPDGTKVISAAIMGGKEIEITTLTLARGRLIVLQDLTEKMRLEESRREFFIDAGHEFRTPLTVIRMGLDLLKSGGSIKDPEDMAGIDSMIGQQERLSSLVDDLLYLVRLDVDPLKRESENVNLSAVAEELVSNLESLTAPVGIKAEADFPKDGAFVFGFYTDIRRALSNLLENSVKYVSSARESGGRIKFTLEESGDFWRFTVDDNGPGIPIGEEKIIFERFRRGDLHRARNGGKTGGYGLGLSISRRIAERHGGTLELAASKLGGACFTMTIHK